MKIAVTGASGHIGNVLCRELIAKDYQVKALVHKNEDDLVKMGASIIFGDVLNKSGMEEFCKDADVVYHLAAKISIDAKEKERVYQTNVQGTQNIIDACLKEGVAKLIHFSSIHTYGIANKNEVLDETNPLIDHSPMIYEDSKAEAERRILNAIDKGLKAVVIKPTAVIGPYDYQPSLLGQALIKIYLNQLPMLVEGGYDFVDVRDVVDAALAAMESGRPGQQYIVSGHWLSLGDLSRLIGEVSGRKTPRLVVPTFIAKIGLPFIQAHAALMGKHPLYTRESLDILKLSSPNISSQKAQEELQYRPRSIRSSLKDILAWYEQNEML